MDVDLQKVLHAIQIGLMYVEEAADRDGGLDECDIGYRTDWEELNEAYEAVRATIAVPADTVRDAAPDMLASLKALLELHINHHNHPVHGAARAAIAKAEG